MVDDGVAFDKHPLEEQRVLTWTTLDWSRVPLLLGRTDGGDAMESIGIRGGAQPEVPPNDRRGPTGEHATRTRLRGGRRRPAHCKSMLPL